jgi:hypothetical protein
MSTATITTASPVWMRWLPHATALLITALFVTSIVIETTRGDIGSGVVFLAFCLATLAVGWLVAWKHPGNSIGWLLLAVAAILGALQDPMDLLGNSLAASAPVIASWLIWASGPGGSGWTWFIAVWLLLIELPLRFPDGSLPSPRWRWLSWAGLGVLVFGCVVLSGAAPEGHPSVASPFVITAGGEAVLTPIFIAVLSAAFIGSVCAMIVRYRNGSEQLRAQIRWVLWAVSIAMVVLIASQFLPANTPDEALLSLWAAGYLLVPVAIGVAVLKYRLYSIDQLISRTVSYSIVTAVVVGFYAGLVIGFTLLLPNLPSLGIALATLIVAAVFLPLLRRVQGFVDRRFNRAAYNAQKVVEAFGERLRSGGDPHAAGGDLVSAVEQTLQPTAVGIWTRTDSR